MKDPFTAIKTFSILLRKFSCKLTVVGSDILRGEVWEFARSLGVEDKIEWKGKVPYEAIPPLLHASDILLMTSLYEGEAVVAMEAFACGVLVAGTRVGLIADYGEESLTVGIGDAEGLADKIVQMVMQPDKIHEIRLKNRRLAEQYTAQWSGSEYKKLYEEVIQQEEVH